MADKQLRMFGTWDSPIPPESVARSARFGDVGWDSASSTLVWTESREESTWLMAKTSGEAARFLTDGDVRIRGSIGYGGGDFTVGDGAVYFAGAGRRIYRLSLDEGLPRPITPAFGAAASPTLSPDGRFVVFVHHDEGVDGLAIVDAEGAQFPQKLAYGDDFVMQPAWHPSGLFIAYIAWNNPQMPWDGTELRLAALSDGAALPHIARQKTIAGGIDTSVFQPEFSPDGRYLAYASDQTGWWQLYLYDLSEDTHRQITDIEAEHATPAWVQGLRTFGWSADSGAIYFLRNNGGKVSLHVYELASGQSRSVEALDPYTQLKAIAVSRTDDQIALIASSTTLPERVITVAIDRMNMPESLSPEAADPDNGEFVLVSGEQEVIVARSKSEMLRNSVSEAQPVEWASFDGETAYGWYYPPVSDKYAGTGAPPMIVSVHGGPTSEARTSFDAKIQFFTTRGYAWLDVNHRGSTGHGKAYKDKLRGMWGVYDVEDSASGALALAERGLADRSKLVIMGGSAGGYTTLQSLTTKPGVYAAGVCLYGIGSQFLLSFNDAWKFEARYNDTLIGILPGDVERFRERSPMFHADKIKDPVIIFHGEADEAVPINQSETMVTALRRRGIPHEFHTYKGEGHGFRKTETIVDYLTKTLRFLEQWVIFR